MIEVIANHLGQLGYRHKLDITLELITIWWPVADLTPKGFVPPDYQSIIILEKLSIYIITKLYNSSIRMRAGAPTQILITSAAIDLNKPNAIDELEKYLVDLMALLRSRINTDATLIKWSAGDENS